MPYNEQIEARITKITSNWENTTHKKMIGGVCHLLKGSMQKILATTLLAPGDNNGRFFKQYFQRHSACY